jgi:hypothetical protein
VSVARLLFVASCVLMVAACSHGSNAANGSRSPYTTGPTTQPSTTLGTTTTTVDLVLLVPQRLRHNPAASARATATCRAAFGALLFNAAPGTVAEVRSWVAGPMLRLGKDAFPGAAPSAVIAWCWLGHAVGHSGDFTDYAVEAGYAPVYMGGIAGLLPSTPPPGPPVYP